MHFLPSIMIFRRSNFRALRIRFATVAALLCGVLGGLGASAAHAQEPSAPDTQSFADYFPFFVKSWLTQDARQFLDVIQFPLQVDCYADGSEGERLPIELFIYRTQRIMPADWLPRLQSAEGTIRKMQPEGNRFAFELPMPGGAQRELIFDKLAEGWRLSAIHCPE
jgi:hypothetical protein